MGKHIASFGSLEVIQHEKSVTINKVNIFPLLPESVPQLLKILGDVYQEGQVQKILQIRKALEIE